MPPIQTTDAVRISAKKRVLDSMAKKYEYTIVTCPGFESSQGARFPYISGSMCLPSWYKCIHCGVDARIHDEEKWAATEQPTV